MQLVTSHISRAVLGLILCLIADGSAINAQQIRGVVRDSSTAAPIPGAVVSLLDGAGRVGVRTIADGSGRFHTMLPVAARQLEVLRIGFRPHKMVLPQAPQGQAVVDIVVDMVRVPTLLETVSVEDRADCAPRGDQAQALALWEQARAALLASVVARQAYSANVEMLVYDRELDRNGHALSQQVSSHSLRSTRPFSPARPPADFAKLGYVTDHASGVQGSEEFTRTYDAPDADVLLDESFASTHCFKLAKGDAAHAGQLGLAFQPAAGRDTLADVAGILWVRPSPAALESIEFRYTGLEPAVTDAGAGGNISFRTMPNGVVFIDRWSLRMPIPAPSIGRRRDPGAPLVVSRRFNRDVRVSRIIEHGGAVATAVWGDGVHWTAPLGRVRGRVVSDDASEAITPTPNAVVWLEGAARRATTDAAGNFAFDRVLPGPYVLQVSDSSLAVFGAVRAETQHVVVTDSATIDSKVVLPPLGRVVERICGKEQDKERGAVAVSLEGVRALDLLGYSVQWSDASGSVFRAGHVDSVGRAAVCDIPVRQPVRVALYGADAGTDTTVLLAPDRVAVVTKRMVGGHSARTSTDGEPVVVVHVADSTNARPSPLAGVEIAMPRGRFSARTNSDGVAVLRGVPAGSHIVFLRAIGHSPVTGVVEVLAHDSLDVSLRMSRTLERVVSGQPATQLPALHVEANRLGLSDRLSGFEERRTSKGNLGYYLTEDSIAKRNALLTTELLLRIPGVRVSNTPAHTGDRIHVYSSHDPLLVMGGIGSNDARAGKPCELGVWLNGMPMDTSFDVNSIPPSSIHGIEVYHNANLPPQFSALTTFTNACGVLVIWTK